MKHPWQAALSLLATATVVLAGCAAPKDPGTAISEATVLQLGTTAGAWTGLDPLLNKSASINHDFFNAIYGQLFRRGSDGEIVPDLAAGFTVAPGGRSVDLTLRPNLTFSDGTLFDASAVAFNLNRDLEPSAGCRCLANFAAVSSATAVGTSTVRLHLTRPDPAIIDAFLDAAPNWIVSPTALRRLGPERFSLMPVGAGPFTVVSDHLNSSLALKANPKYWRSGYPKLDRLTFVSVADDTTAYSALRAKQADLYMAFGNPALLAEMSAHFQAVPVPATQTEAINLNPSAPSLSDPTAREAIYYATDAAAVNEHIFKGAGTVSQTPGGPADLYWTATVPGYRSYDLARAREIVQRLGGVSFTLSVLNTPIQIAIGEALQSQWAEAGITAKISVITIPQAVKQSHEGSLQAIATQVGSYDPSLVPGLSASYSSTGPFSLIKDPALDRLISAAAAETEPGPAAGKYQQVYRYLSQKAYAPFLFTAIQWNVASKSVRGLSPQESEVDWSRIEVG
jgi:peptide/nickel transport system substrate-binding protein